MRRRRRSRDGVWRFAADTFVQNTTLRGFRKCFSASSRALRVHWLCYLLSMAVLLSYGTYDLFKEFLQFHTSYQLEERVNDPTPFPSLTVCSLNPFAEDAERLWNSGSVVSPAKFSKLVRESIGDFARGRKFSEAQTLFQNDKVTTYFQFLNETAVKAVCHRYEDLVPFCLMRHSANANPSVAHEEECSFRWQQMHHPEYFCCYKLQLPRNESRYISSVSLILSNSKIGFAANASASQQQQQRRRLQQRHRQQRQHAFNIFNEGSGFRILLHEPATRPEVDAASFSVKMRSSTLIRYRTVSVEKVDSPTSRCSSAADLPTVVTDDDEEYAYTHSACVSSRIGEFIQRQCGCVSAFHVRPPPGRRPASFCSFFNSSDPVAFVRRLRCVRKLNISQLMAEVSQKRLCPRRCSYFAYESQLSAADWVPHLWQVHWMSHISDVLRRLAVDPDDPSCGQQLQQLLQFASLDSIVGVGVDDPTAMSEFESEMANRMAMVTVRRLSYNTMVNRESLQISVSGLVSRLGGLGSLTLGVTLTCAFELLELLYLVANRLLAGRPVAKDAEIELQSLKASGNDPNCGEPLLLQSASHGQQASYYDNVSLRG